MTKKKSPAPVTIDEQEVTTNVILRRYTIPSLGISVDATDAKDAVIKANKKVKDI